MNIVIKRNVSPYGVKDITIIDITNPSLHTLSYTGNCKDDKPVFDAIESAYEEAIANDLGYAYIEQAFNDAIGKNKEPDAPLITEFGATIDPAEQTIEFPNGIVFSREVTEVFKYMTSEEEAKRFVKFVELLGDNPRTYVYESLTQWILQNPTLEILEDGRIKGYRGLRSDYKSIHSGYGIVNGVEVHGHLDNTPGNILEFPVSLTDHNAEHACSIGLHVGTKEYAENFGSGKYVTVAFSPADVVSSVLDSEQGKLRVSKMEILEEFYPQDKQSF